MAEQKILKRCEVPEEYTWNLKDMFESDEAWLAEYEALKEKTMEAMKAAGDIPYVVGHIEAGEKGVTLC